jgi:hypothetical protein
MYLARAGLLKFASVLHGVNSVLSGTLEEFFTYVQRSRAEVVRVVNKVAVSEKDHVFEHVFEIIAEVISQGQLNEFRFEVGKVLADHEMREDKKESSPEYARFQQALVSMFHRVNTIEGRLKLIKRNMLPDLQVVVEA